MTTHWDGQERRQSGTSLHEEIKQRLLILELKVDDFHRDIRRLVGFIDGNGTSGAKIRLDRLEQVAKVLIWMTGTFGTVVIALVVNTFVTLIRHGP